MEVAGVDKIQTVAKLAKKEGVQAARIHDTLSISSESKKRAEWVELLKLMPDIRPEKIASLSSEKTQPAQLFKEVAHQILNS